MLPLLELRNALDVQNDKPLRDFRRMTGAITLFHDEPVHGPYTPESRHEWLKRVLDAQAWIRVNGPDSVRGLELISLEELREIRRIWVFEKHEIEDSLPSIYAESTGEPFPDGHFDEVVTLQNQDLDLLRELCGEDDLHYEMTRSLISVERRYRTMARRANLFDALEKTIRRSFYTDEEDAVSRARALQEVREVRAGVSDELPVIAAEPTKGDAQDTLFGDVNAPA